MLEPLADIDLSTPAGRSQMGILICTHMEAVCHSEESVLDIILSDTGVVIKWCPP